MTKAKAVVSMTHKPDSYHLKGDDSCRCYKNAFWFVTLLYPRCAQTSMQMFATQTLDVGTYLKADYSIATRNSAGDIVGAYAAYLVFGTILVILFTLVLPIFYFMVIYRLRYRLEVCAKVIVPSSLSEFQSRRDIFCKTLWAHFKRFAILKASSALEINRRKSTYVHCNQ